MELYEEIRVLRSNIAEEKFSCSKATRKKAMDFLSTSDVIKATSVTNIFLDISVSQSLSSSTPYTYVKKVEDTTRELRGGEFIGNSFAHSSEGSFVYHP